MTEQIRPFTIDVPEAELDDLRRRLHDTRWPDAEVVDDWSQGVPLAYVREVCRYWADDYDWRTSETALNRFDQFVTEIDGLDIHFIHHRSSNPDAIPLLITHGWPGSVVEFHKVIEPLTDPTAHGGVATDAFHVIAPSLPGFGFSGKPTRTGWGVEKIGEVWAELMARLGYDRYVAQGGDWGSAVTTAIGAQDPDHCVAIHLTLAMGARPVATPEAARRTARHRALAVLQGVGLGLFDPAEVTSPDGRLRAVRLAGRSGGVDHREVLGLDRLRRPSRERPVARRDARQRDAVLDHRIGHVVGSDLLGELRSGQASDRHDPDRIHRVPQGDRSDPCAAGSSSSTPTCSIGPNTTRAATSPRSRCPTRSSPT